MLSCEFQRFLAGVKKKTVDGCVWSKSAHSCEDEECRKRPRSKRECAKAHLLLFYSDGLRQISRFIHIHATAHRDVIGEQLKRDDCQ